MLFIGTGEFLPRVIYGVIGMEVFQFAGELGSTRASCAANDALVVGI